MTRLPQGTHGIGPTDRTKWAAEYLFHFSVSLLGYDSHPPEIVFLWCQLYKLILNFGFTDSLAC